MNTRRIALQILLPNLLVSGMLLAQDNPQPLVKYTGCVARLQTAKPKYVLATGNRCLLLGGKFDPEKIADHKVTLEGTLADPNGLIPLSLVVKSTLDVKEVCSQTCTLEPPGSRGVHGHEVPGSEGGPAGATAPPPKPQQQ